jgi:hypothetical protein
VVKLFGVNVRTSDIKHMYRERLSTSNQEMQCSKISDLIPQVVCCIVAHIGICIICICVLLCSVHSLNNNFFSSSSRYISFKIYNSWTHQ